MPIFEENGFKIEIEYNKGIIDQINCFEDNDNNFEINNPLNDYIGHYIVIFGYESTSDEFLYLNPSDSHGKLIVTKEILHNNIILIY